MRFIIQSRSKHDDLSRQQRLYIPIADGSRERNERIKFDFTADHWLIPAVVVELTKYFCHRPTGQTAYDVRPTIRN